MRWCVITCYICILSPQLDRGTGTVVSSAVRGIKVEEGAGETTGMTITVVVVATPVAEGEEGVGVVEPDEIVVGETETVEDMVKTRVVVQNMAGHQTLTKAPTLHLLHKQTTTPLTMAQHSSRLP